MTWHATPRGRITKVMKRARKETMAINTIGWGAGESCISQLNVHRWAKGHVECWPVPSCSTWQPMFVANAPGTLMIVKGRGSDLLLVRRQFSRVNECVSGYAWVSEKVGGWVGEWVSKCARKRVGGREWPSELEIWWECECAGERVEEWKRVRD